VHLRFGRYRCILSGEAVDVSLSGRSSSLAKTDSDECHQTIPSEKLTLVLRFVKCE
jgi:hypothetical protein